MTPAASVADYRERARARLPRFLFDYIDGGAYAETTLRRNEADLEAVALRQRVLRDVSQIDASIELFGCRMAMPVALGPIGLAGMFARRGEAQALAAAQAAGVPFCLSTVSICSLGELAGANAAPIWFQLYMLRDRGFMRDVLARAREAKCPALVFTVDLPLPGARYRDVRSGLAGARGFAAAFARAQQVCTRPAWLWDVGVRGRPHRFGNIASLLDARSGLNDFLGWVQRNFDPSVTWRDIAWVRQEWPGPLIVKGVMEVEDARAAIEAGADAIVVSNHGGRQLDGVVSTARALPPIVDAVADRAPVLADGGVRSGLDVARMLALGARAVLLGRAWAYGLAAGGERGVAHVLRIVAAELHVALALTGCRTVAELDRNAVTALDKRS